MIIGAILAFFTPIGGVLQFIGSLGFMLTASTTSFAGIELIFWIGAAMGLFASVMVLLSLVAPIGVGYEKEKTDAISRLLTISVYRQSTGYWLDMLDRHDFRACLSTSR